VAPTANGQPEAARQRHPAEKLDQRLVLYSPLPDNDTAVKLEQLMSSRPTLRQPAPADAPAPAPVATLAV
jgi:hypothetical protein